MSEVSLDSLAKELENALDRDAEVLLGYSGGLDSAVLLHVAVRALDPQRLRVLHCDHGIATESAEWADFCRTQVAGLGLRLHIERLHLGAATNEGRARAARYRCFETVLAGLRRPVLLLAHHADDQVETLLFRLLRGAGPRGLCGIPRTRPIGQGGRLYRPFLRLHKAQLRNLAETAGIAWIDDPSNAQTHADRNHIRNRLLPLIIARWPEAARRIGRVGQLQAETHCLLEAYADELLARADRRPADFGCSYDLALLAALPEAQFALCIRRLLETELRAQVSREQGRQIRAQFVESRPDGTPRMDFAAGSLRRFAGRLYLLQTMPDPLPSASTFDWDSRAELSLPPLGRLQQRAADPAQFRVRFRQAGERVWVAGSTQSKSLKSLLQEQGIEPWLRDRLPLIFYRDKLVAIADRRRFTQVDFVWQWGVED